MPWSHEYNIYIGLCLLKKDIHTQQKKNNKENVDFFFFVPPFETTLRYQKHSCCIHFTLAHISYRRNKAQKINLKNPKLEQMLLHCRVYIFLLSYFYLKAFRIHWRARVFFLMPLCWRPPASHKAPTTTKFFLVFLFSNIIRWDFSIFIFHIHFVKLM